MMQHGRRILFILLFSLLLMSCSNTQQYAPVVSLSTIEPIPKAGTHRVKKGETLYAIAWRYGLDDNLLATINQLPEPWHVKTGQVIRLRTHKIKHKQTLQQAKIKIIQKSHKRIAHHHPKPKPIATTHEAAYQSCHVLPLSHAWHWPAHGSVHSIYSSFNKGINISGRLGDPVFATEAGEVVYQGNGLRGYGNLIIIRHSGSWLSAYAWNNDVLVKQGQCVHRGQRIATMGQGINRLAMLHFEIRRSGRPVNPLHYLSDRS